MMEDEDEKDEKYVVKLFCKMETPKLAAT